MSSTNPLSISNITCGWKGKACASTPSKLPSTSTPSPKKQGRRKVGACAWTIKDYLLVFCIISMVRPVGSNQWEIVGKNMMAQSFTAWSSKVCKNHWVKVLKLPKPTRQSKMHPLHCLALAVKEGISKLHAMGLLDDLSAPDKYKETEIEFNLAETKMRRLRLDFKCAPNFKVPLLDEDAKVKDNAGNCRNNKTGASRNPSEVWVGLDNKVVGDSGDSGAGKGAENCNSDREEDWPPISMATDPQADSKLPLWGLHLSNIDTTIASLSKAMLLPKAPTTPKPLAHSLAVGATLTSLAPFPMLKLCLNKAQAHLPSKAPSATATGSHPLVKMLVKLEASPLNKRKAPGSAWANRDHGSKKPKLEAKPTVWRPEPKALSSNNIIDLISDNNGEFISSYLKQQEEGNFKTIVYMQLGWKKICKLELKLIEYKLDKKVQEHVKEALAQHALAPMAPAGSVPMQYFATSGCKDMHSTINNLDCFNPLHPFNK
ncbi:hypothetical protein RhiXN_09630 [Rhizoctonia solani]|uniref:Myb-like domain-containing protein n=1 Tax=Rhizoctonia solani TaxID=456999 RepID=A0A8H8P1C3_9AGAM|nr:uncharacterized protein RhiXN_09630 [Rhizoctonia solani]QRW22043.1 hypothetical protein RhiXN_09630 [Rhizoctonia solani]